METRLQEEEMNKVNSETEQTTSSPAESDDTTTPTQADGAPRKKYHSSAMYAASKWHNTVAQVRPTHAKLNL
jgi:hypothetical protein